MPILLVHNRYQERGGEDTIFENEAQLLRGQGHQVTCLEFDNADIPSRRSLVTAVRLAASTIWSVAAADRVKDAIRNSRARVVHFHNTFPLVSPSAYSACRKAGLPVIQTAQNYRLLCPNALFSRDDRPCEDCLGKLIPWPGILHSCYRSSRRQTAAVAGLLVAHRIKGTWNRNVDVYVPPSEFVRRKLIEGGLPEDKIVVKPNFVNTDPGLGPRDGNFVLFVGRLANYKGVDTMLRAWERYDDLPQLRIIGDGPLSETVAQAAKANANIDHVGQISHKDVLEWMGRATALLFPSECYETFGLTMVEGFACGLPVIASQLGAMGEIVQDRRTGLHFEPGNPLDLADKVRWAWNHPEELHQMGLTARREYEKKYTADQNYQQLMQIYDRALAGTSRISR